MHNEPQSATVVRFSLEERNHWIKLSNVVTKMNFVGRDYQVLGLVSSVTCEATSSANCVVCKQKWCCMRARLQLYEVTVLVTMTRHCICSAVHAAAGYTPCRITNPSDADAAAATGTK